MTKTEARHDHRRFEASVVPGLSRTSRSDAAVTEREDGGRQADRRKPARSSFTCEVAAPVYLLVTRKWPRRFCCQQASSLSVQNGASSPLLTVMMRSAEMPRLTR